MSQRFRYQNVYVEAFSHLLPGEVVTTDQLEGMLSPLYKRLKLPFGRLELMTGIQERRLWPAGTLPGDHSVRTVERLLRTTGIDRNKVGALIHASVCRDYQEPATACAVHQRLGLSQQGSVFDISNACLGLLTGITQIANMIELEQIEAGIVVGTESSRTLMETTIAAMNADESIDRQTIKRAFASLTIGSGSAAVLLTNRRLSRTRNRLLGGVVQANTDQCHLCRSEIDVSAGGRGNGQLMWTDSGTLLQEGIAVAHHAFSEFCPHLGWSSESIDRFFCHQVGRAHQQLLFERLELETEKNFVT
ncbi:MAG: 3-oxoacyl-ACP synthase III, partial [Thermoguttaceae bacterium]|nr:3-oxoacyl-ACP synthase III [Thermoguttaceae bacterium]